MESAVTLREVEAGIVQLTMQDRASKNTLSYELSIGLMDAFQAIQDN